MPRSREQQRQRKRRLEAMRSDLVGFVSDLPRRVVAKAMSGLRGAGDWLFGVPVVSLRPHPRRHRCMPQQELPRDSHPSCREVFQYAPWRRKYIAPTHVCAAEGERESDFHGGTLLHLSHNLLEPTTTQSSTCTTMNTLRARSTKSDVCASES